ncbi:MAG: hypothetical protein HY043_21455 [Verrucomicrobia bacterium]|nr:hypothetical protein [Verrucomicrobiota bacterium]
MNVRITRFLKTAGAITVASVLLGCEGKSAKLAQSDKPAATTPLVSNTNNLPATDETTAADLDAAPLRTIEPAALPMSAGVEDVIKLAQSGVGDSVILAYIENSTVTYELAADDITYLNDVGVSDDVMKAMIEHGSKLREQEKNLATKPAELDKAVAAAKQSQAADAKNPAPPQPGVQPAAAPAVVTEAPAPQYVSTPPPIDATPAPLLNAPQEVNYFYSSLSPYGSWIELPAYGWCWQPTVAVVNTGWRPYCHSGRWLYSDCGWYWHSDYSWGWAPFHYGRWHHNPRVGWVWFPDSVWAPAWVTWRNTDGYCGWAPLPYGFHCGAHGSTYRGVAVGVGFDFGLTAFHFSWVSHRNFADRAPVHHLLPADRAGNVYANSKVINNIVVGNNNTIINQGVGFDKISSVSRTEVAKVSVRDLPTAPQKALKPDRIERDDRRHGCRGAGAFSPGIAQRCGTGLQFRRASGCSRRRGSGGSGCARFGECQSHRDSGGFSLGSKASR